MIALLNEVAVDYWTVLSASRYCAFNDEIHSPIGTARQQAKICLLLSQQTLAEILVMTGA